MKKFVLGLLALFIFFGASGQKIYWSVYNFKVKNGDEEKVLSAFDKFMKSPTGKKMPTAAFNVAFFKNSSEEYTHQVIFSSTDAEQFGEMYSGKLNQTSDFALLASVLDQHTKSSGSYLGKSLAYAPIPSNRYSNIILMSVTDPGTYFNNWKMLRDAVTTMSGGKIAMDLHQFISGNEPGVTHVAVVTAPDMAELLKFNDTIYESDAFAKFAKAVKGIRTIVSNNTTMNVALYNVPEMAGN